MGLDDFFKQMDHKREKGYERSRAAFEERVRLEQEQFLPKKKKEDPAIPSLISYKKPGPYREFKIVAKDGRSVLVQHPDPAEASNIGEDFLRIQRYSGDRIEVHRDPFWDKPRPPDGNPYLGDDDKDIVLDMSNMTYTINGYPFFTGRIIQSTKTWPGHKYIIKDDGTVRWIP